MRAGSPTGPYDCPGQSGSCPLKTAKGDRMFKASMTFATLSLLALLAGCAKDRPHEYGEQRPPIGQLTPGDTGLQSKDVVDASDQLAMDLLALPELNASREQWTVAVDHVENYTTDPRFNYDIFIERLRINLAR